MHRTASKKLIALPTDAKAAAHDRQIDHAANLRVQNDEQRHVGEGASGHQLHLFSPAQGAELIVNLCQFRGPYKCNPALPSKCFLPLLLAHALHETEPRPVPAQLTSGVNGAVCL